MRIQFGPKKPFKVWCSGEWHFCLKIEPSQETWLLETIPTAVHMLCDTVLCQHDWLSSFKNIGHYDLMWSNMVNPLVPELKPSEQRCLPEFLTGTFKF